MSLNNLMRADICISQENQNDRNAIWNRSGSQKHIREESDGLHNHSTLSTMTVIIAILNKAKDIEIVH